MIATYDNAVALLRKSRETMERERDYYEMTRIHEREARATYNTAQDVYLGNVSMVCDLFGVEYWQVVRDVKGER